MKTQKFCLLINRYFTLAAIFTLIQQLIVASSTYFIAKLGESFGAGEVSLGYIVLFIVSLVVVYVPAYFAIIFAEKGNYLAWQSYLNRFEQVFLGKATLFNDDKLKQHTIALISQESKDTISDASAVGFDLLALLLNVFLNILVISFVIDGKILLAYALGMILSTVFIYALRHIIHQSADTAQNARLALISQLHQSWDNIILNNRYNHQRYQTTTNTQFDQTTHDNLKAASVRYISASVGMILMITPVLAMIFWLFKQNWQNGATLAVLIATLPRQVQLLQMCYTLISYNVGISMIKTRLSGLLALFETPIYSLTPFIQSDKIFVKQTEQPFNKDKLPSTGRITLIGKNGVGKSCLLLSLKAQWQDGAYYLPAKHQLSFDTKNSHQGSTGEQLLRQLDELYHQLDGVKVLLLDEWDAHLDNDNIALIHQRLDDWAKTKLVIEIRHFKNKAVSDLPKLSG